MVNWKDAYEEASQTLRELRPYCDYIRIAGSIRRMKPEVKDIEIVCIPKTEPSGLFNDVLAINYPFVNMVNNWEKVKGEPSGKYTQRVLPSGMKLDLFMATPENVGLIFFIRTGSREFNIELFERLKQEGFRSERGHLYQATPVGDRRISVRHEEFLFELADMPYVEPALREA